MPQHITNLPSTGLGWDARAAGKAVLAARNHPEAMTLGEGLVRNYDAQEGQPFQRVPLSL